MSNVVIRCQGLAKKYRIRHEKRQRYTTLRDLLTDRVRRVFRPGPSGEFSNPRREEFWALKDVSFEIKQGEVVGIIGRNGAGKSTLLKILSRVTEPTLGRVELTGRVGSLLEVGTGFHSELTGRENIFLNGAILGMANAEIKRKFDEIVEFSGVENFLDTPVKRYSSGMYVRLAFAVAAHLESEILIVDEVLAVGDAEFQKKCLGKMEKVAKGGRTVIFVSHNLGSVQTLCDSGILFDRGQLRIAGPIPDVVSEYTRALSTGPELETEVALGLAFLMSGLELCPADVRSGDSLEIKFRLQARTVATLRELAVIISSSNGIRVGVLDLRREGILNSTIATEPVSFSVKIAALPLVEGDYYLGFHLATDEERAERLDFVSFNVSPSGSLGSAVYAARYRGIVQLDFSLDRSPALPTH
jgi:lipopolysaccharide transport system ATP-binding protein